MGRSFLRSLNGHNDREWFRERKDDYQRHVRGPMVQAIERLAVDMRTFATGTDFYPTLLTTFKTMMPLLRFLNEAIQQASARTLDC